jgi:hypothetical protein
MKKVKDFLGKATLIWVLLTAIGYFLFPILAVVLTFAANINFHKMIYTSEGTIRVYFSLQRGTPLYQNPVKGNKPAWILTGDALVEQTRYIMPGEAYVNPDDYYRDPNSYHRVCLRLGTSPADIAAFAANRGCYWLRNRDGDQYEPITTVPILRAEWERLEDLSKRNQSSFELAYPPGLAASTLLTVAPFSAAMAIIINFLIGTRTKRHREELSYT